MGRTCPICSSRSRRAIDAMLATEEHGSARHIARLFPAFSRKQIRAHWSDCLLRSPRLMHLLRAGAMSLEDFGAMLREDGKSEQEVEEIVLAVGRRVEEVA